MIQIGMVVRHEHHWTERNGYFVIEEIDQKPGWFIGRKIMRLDGSIIKASKQRVRLDQFQMTAVYAEDAQKRYIDHMESARIQAQTELDHLMKYIR